MDRRYQALSTQRKRRRPGGLSSTTWRDSTRATPATSTTTSFLCWRRTAAIMRMKSRSCREFLTSSRVWDEQVDTFLSHSVTVQVRLASSWGPWRGCCPPGTSWQAWPSECSTPPSTSGTTAPPCTPRSQTSATSSLATSRSLLTPHSLSSVRKLDWPVWAPVTTSSRSWPPATGLLSSLESPGRRGNWKPTARGFCLLSASWSGVYRVSRSSGALSQRRLEYRSIPSPSINLSTT